MKTIQVPGTLCERFRREVFEVLVELDLSLARSHSVESTIDERLVVLSPIGKYSSATDS
jgi:hypothetical protein